MSKCIYREAAAKRFEKLLKLLEGPHQNFWQVGQSFDTIIDYLDCLEKVNDPNFKQSAEYVVHAVVQQFLSQTLNWCWFDDFGWWTISTSNFLQKSYFESLNITPDDKNIFCTINSWCWTGFTENAPIVPEVWKSHRRIGNFDDCQPAVSGGVWNILWDGTSFDPKYKKAPYTGQSPKSLRLR